MDKKIKLTGRMKVVGMLERMEKRKEIDVKAETLLVGINIVDGTTMGRDISITGEDHEIIISKAQAIDLIKQLQDHVSSDHVFIEDREKVANS